MKQCLECGRRWPDQTERCEECGGRRFHAIETDEPDVEPVAFDFTNDEPGATDREAPRAGQAEIINDLEQLDALKAEGLFIVGLLGFPTGGKTWFLERLKRSYHQPKRGSPQARRPACVPSPPAADEGDNVERTNDISRHRFTVRSRPSRGFNLLDIPGERFVTAARKNFVGVNDLTLSALRACDALIIVLPAEDVLFASRIADRRRRNIYRQRDAGRKPPELAQLESLTELEAELAEAASVYKREGGRRLEKEVKRLTELVNEHREWRLAEAANDVDRFAKNVGQFAAVLHLLDNGYDIDRVAALEREADVMREAEKVGGHKRREPVFIALSKMDAAIEPNPFMAGKLDGIDVGPEVRRRLDVDPLAALQEYSPGIAQQAFDAFEWCKVDAVTAFGGHPGGPQINYAAEVYGVEPLIEWIHWARGMASGRRVAQWEAYMARFIRQVRDMAD